jgi:hypothetical protein
VQTGKMVLVIFLMVDAAYIGRIMRREAQALRRRMPRWRGAELAFPMAAAFTAGSDVHATRQRFHEQLDRWLDRHLAGHAPEAEPSDSHDPGNHRAA